MGIWNWKRGMGKSLKGGASSLHHFLFTNSYFPDNSFIIGCTKPVLLRNRASPDSFLRHASFDVMDIQMVDLRGQYLALKGEIDAAIAEVLASTRFIKGPIVGQLEWCVSKERVGRSPVAQGFRLGLSALFPKSSCWRIRDGRTRYVVRSPARFIGKNGDLELEKGNGEIVEGWRLFSSPFSIYKFLFPR